MMAMSMKVGEEDQLLDFNTVRLYDSLSHDLISDSS